MDMNPKKFLLIFTLLIIVSELALRLGGFILSLKIENRLNFMPFAKNDYRIMALGDSTTALWGPIAWPAQLEEILNKKNLGKKFTVINKAIPGSNSYIILSRLQENIDKYHPDMVIVMSGINDNDLLPVNTTFIPTDEKSADNLFQTAIKRLKLYKVFRFIFLNISNKIGVHAEANLDEQGFLYQQQGNYKKAEEIYKEAILLNPKNIDVYHKLGYVYQITGQFIFAEELYKQAIKMVPESDTAHVDLGLEYFRQKRYREAKDLYEKATVLNPRSYFAHYLLADILYDPLKDYKYAEKIYKKAIELVPNNSRTYFGLSQVYIALNRPDEAEKIKSEGIAKSAIINPETKKNYLKIKEVLTGANIKLVAMQYPFRSIEIVKNMLKNDPDVIYIDNERIFAEAVNDTNYNKYFSDRFAGDFGHPTPLGFRLIANNLVNVLIAEVFSK